MIPLLAKTQIELQRDNCHKLNFNVTIVRNFKLLAIFCDYFSSILVRNPNAQFSRIAAHMTVYGLSDSVLMHEEASVAQE